MNGREKRPGEKEDMPLVGCLLLVIVTASVLFGVYFFWVS